MGYNKIVNNEGNHPSAKSRVIAFQLSPGYLACIAMLPYTTELYKDQYHRYCNDLAGREAEANRNSDLQSNGEFDGKCGLKCHRPESHAYWHGYCVGLRERLLEEQGKLEALKGEKLEF